MLQADKLDSAGKHERALSLLKEVAEDPAARGSALARMARCEWRHSNKNEEAFAHIGEAIVLEPRKASHYVDRAIMYTGMRMPDRALEDLTIARPLADSDPILALVEGGFGYVCLKQRRFDEALAHIDRVLALDSTDLDAWCDRATVLGELDRNEEALQILLKLHDRRPENKVYMNNVGYVLSCMERYAEALPWYDRSLALQDDAYSFNNRGYAKLRTGDAAGALKDVQRSIKLNAGNSYAHRNLGLILKEKGEKDKACDAFEEAMRLGFTKQYGPEVKTIHDAYCK